MTLRKPSAADSLVLVGATSPRGPQHLRTSVSNNQVEEADASDLKSRKFFSSQLCNTLHLPAMRYVSGQDAHVYNQPCIMAGHLSGEGTRSLQHVSFHISIVAPNTGCQYPTQTQRPSQQSPPPGRRHLWVILADEGLEMNPVHEHVSSGWFSPSLLK